MAKWNPGALGRGLAYDAEIARRRSGGRKAALTGVEEIDKKLRELPTKTINKMARKSLKQSGKLVLGKTKQIIEQETDGEGAYAESMKVQAWRPSKKQKAKFGDQIGVAIMPPRKVYFAKYEEKYGKLPNPSPKYNASQPFYVPAALEFGWTDRSGNYHEPIAPQRKALYDSQSQVIANFQQDMRELIKETAQ